MAVYLIHPVAPVKKILPFVNLRVALWKNIFLNSIVHNWSNALQQLSSMLLPAISRFIVCQIALRFNVSDNFVLNIRFAQRRIHFSLACATTDAKMFSFILASPRLYVIPLLRISD